MPNKTGIADKPNSAEASQAAARPAVTQTAKGKKAADAGKEIEYDLPTAAEVAAHLLTEPAVATDEDADVDVDADEYEEDTPEEKAALEAEIEEGVEASEEKENDEAEEGSDESEDASESSDDSKEDSGDEETEEEVAAEEIEAAAPAQKKKGEVKRIGELTARAKTAEEEAARLREQVATANYSEPAFGALAMVDDLAGLNKAAQNELALHKWALINETNAEGADLPDGKGGTRHFEPDEIRQIKANTFEALYSHIPARREYLAKRASADSDAMQAYPWLRQLKSGDGAEVQALIEARPYLRQAPDYRTLAADAHVGAKLRKAGLVLDDKALAALLKGKAPTLKAGAKPTSDKPGAKPALVAPIVRRTAPSPSRPGVLPPRINGREAGIRAADKRLKSSEGNLDSIANSIAARMR